MRKKVNGKRLISKLTLFVSAVLLMTVTFHSCQQDEIILESEEMGLKSSLISEIVLDYPDEVNAGENFDITFSSTCGRIMIERGFVEEVDVETGETTKVFCGLTCDMDYLLWEFIEADEFESCQGETIAQNLEETGTYVYRAKLNFKAKMGSDCPDCGDFVGNLFECFTITVVAGGGNENEGTFTDARDGNVYKWVKIGNQVWMAENLAFLPESGSYAYANNEENVATYGRLYTWDAAMASCPAGWHLPTIEEVEALWSYLIDNGYGYNDQAYQIAKSLASATGWESYDTYPGSPGYNPEGNNSSGFSALPGGFYLDGDFYDKGTSAYWWTSSENSESEAQFWFIGNWSSSTWQNSNYKSVGFSVRCLRE